MKKIGIIRFLGTNCDRDVFQSVSWSNKVPEYIWYADHFKPSDYEALVIPGGFGYGDYLRAGALCARTPVMDSVREAAQKGIPVLGICNGFQILCEAGLLPGALLQNHSGRFIDQWVELEVQNRVSPLSSRVLPEKAVLPVAHKSGRYYLAQDQVKQMNDQELIWLRYSTEVNGSVDKIAGVINERRNVFGLMPHPERAAAEWMGGTDGLRFFS